MKNHQFYQKRLKQFSLFSLFFFNIFSYSQCLDSGGIGSFTNTTDFNSDWFTSTEGNATFQISDVGSFYGSSSLKINVPEESTLQTSIYNKAGCYFPITNGQEYTISFYAKGKVGNDFVVTLMDETTDIATSNQKIQLDEWTSYTLKFTANTTSSNGKLKLNFLNKGDYYIDELVVKTGGFKTWYVSPNGTNSIANNNGLSNSSPLKTISYAINTAWTTGDIIYVMDGVYRNNNYGSGNKNNSAVVSINKAGSLNGPLVVRNYPGHSPKIEFDGSGGFVCGTGKYLEISGFQIQGPNQKITKAEAEANRLNTNNYYKGRGIAVWAGSGGNHIILHSNKVYDCPASGIRINNSDYCIITNNEVSNCTNWSSAAESAIVLAQSKNIDSQSKIKMRITKNKVHDNVNKIHYYNRNYNCTNTTDYGCLNFPKIIDGSGCYITRNNDRGSGENDENPNGQFTGAFYFANNISYGNGINGLVVHKSDNSIVVNNTIYKNGQVPLSEGRQNAVGITVNNSANVRIYNNIVFTEFASDTGFQKYGTVSNIQGGNNILVNGNSNIGALVNNTTSDPLFVNLNNFDFRLKKNSAALNIGSTNNDVDVITGTSESQYIPVFDIENNPRNLTAIDIGAYESVDLNNDGIADHLEILSSTSLLNHPNNKLIIYPNPSINYINFSGVPDNASIYIYNILGKKEAVIIDKAFNTKETRLNISKLKSGLYFLKITSKSTTKEVKFIKK